MRVVNSWILAAWLSKRLRNRLLASALDAPIRVAKTIELGSIRQRSLQGLVKRIDIRLEIERVADTALNTNPLAFVVQLRLHGRPRMSGQHSRRFAAGHSAPNEVLARPTGNPSGLVRGFALLGDQAVALAVSVGTEQLLAAGNFQIQEDIVGQDGRALRELVVPFPIFLRPCLIEVDDGLSWSLLRACRRGNGQRKQ